MALTPRQKDVLDFIAGFVGEKGFCPSYEEIGEGLGLASLATVHKHISALEARGYLVRSFNQSRSLEIAPKYYAERGPRPGSATLEIPLAGRIAAGAPVESVEGSETVSFGELLGGDRFALAVRGESMIEDHICDGDYVLVEKAANARNGEIVVALVGGSESTLKRYYSEPGGMVRLQPANAKMQPIRVPASDVVIQGRVLAVLRKYC
jgi:repressor LexA